MHKVYMNSYCNVSSDWGSDVRRLFFPRDLCMLDTPCIDLDLKREESETVESHQCVLVENEFWQDQVSRSPLSSRGWVVQERWLSRRHLRFGPREVFFECVRHTVCERFPETLPPQLCEGDVILKSHSHLLRDPSADRGQATPGTALYDAWEGILVKYSSCQLTYGSDRLVAISGIAQFFHGLLGDKYVGGLWLGNLQYEMMWFRNRLDTTAVVEDPKDRLHLFKKNQQGEYVAPTFSWASCSVPIQANHLNTNLGFLVDIKCIKYRAKASDPDIPWTEDIFGPMTGPTVEVKVIGNLKKMRLYACFDNEVTDLYVIPDGPKARHKNLKNWDAKISSSLSEATLDFRVRNDDLEAFTAGTNYFYIPWQDHFEKWIPEDANRKRDESFTCLLLELVDEKMGCLKRIGRMWTHLMQQREVCLEELGNENVLPCAHYDGDTTRHTIYVI